MNIRGPTTMHFNLKGLLRIILITKSFWIIAKAEYTSALVDLEPLLKTNAQVVSTIEKYMELEEKRLDKIKRYKDEYDKLYKTATSDVDTFLSNPVNAYLLVKRLTLDWKNVVSLMNLTSSKGVIENITQNEVFPNSDDLDESAAALLRLQDTYLLDTTQLSKGEISEMPGTSELTTSDCFELGLQAYAQHDFKFALLWMQEALDRLGRDDKNEIQSVNKSILFDHMAFSAYTLGNLEYALKLTKNLLAVHPDHPHARKNLMFYEKEFQEKMNKNETMGDADETGKKTKINNTNPSILGDIDDNFIDIERYKKLCRGDRLKSLAEESRLSCRYTTSNSKYFLLQPIKEEVLNLDPKIILYHDVIRDSDIELLKEISGPMLERATVLNPETGLLEYAPYRISKSGWLGDHDHPRVRHISLMIEEVTGLEIDTAEYLQINKYGLGGHYEGHYDFRRDGEADAFAKFGTGNRIATWMFYLSDVDAGGSTVFPDLDVQAKPVKGSAAFWFNLLKSGKGDLRTKHAACPVLAGTKWVANKWLHEKQQEFRRPCSLNPLE